MITFDSTLPLQKCSHSSSQRPFDERCFVEVSKANQWQFVTRWHFFVKVISHETVGIPSAVKRSFHLSIKAIFRPRMLKRLFSIEWINFAFNAFIKKKNWSWKFFFDCVINYSFVHIALFFFPQTRLRRKRSHFNPNYMKWAQTDAGDCKG